MKVVVVGDVMNDLVVRTHGTVEIGSDTESEIQRSPGGSGANLAAWLGSLGIPVVFYGRVGAADATEHAAALQTFGVEARLSIDHEVPTGNIVGLVTSDGERHMFTDRGANRRLAAGDLPQDLDDVDHLHVSGYGLFDPATRPPVAALIAEGVRRAVPVSVDPSSESYLREMGPPLFISLTAGVEMIFPNGPEARLLSGCSDDRDAARALVARYPVVVMTLGARGALVAPRAGALLHVGAPSAPVVDTTGAGDAFCAGFLAARLMGAGLKAALPAGVQAAARAIAQMGARPCRDGSAEPC